jgi:hypothetical protein
MQKFYQGVLIWNFCLWIASTFSCTIRRVQDKKWTWSRGSKIMGIWSFSKRIDSWYVQHKTERWRSRGKKATQGLISISISYKDPTRLSSYGWEFDIVPDPTFVLGPWGCPKCWAGQICKKIPQTPGFWGQTPGFGVERGILGAKNIKNTQVFEWKNTKYSCGRHKPALDFDDVRNLGVKKGKNPKKRGQKGTRRGLQWCF